MSNSQDYVLKARLELQDNMSKGLKNSKKGLEELKNTAKNADIGIRSLERDHRIGLSIKDSTSSTLSGIKSRLNEISNKKYTAFVDVKQRGMEKVKSSLSSIGGSAIGASTQMMAGAGISYGLYDTLKTATDFESSMSSVFATTMLDKNIAKDAKVMDELTAKAMEMGSKTSFSASQSAEAFNYMAMAGWKASDMMNGIDGVMNLAAASGEDLGRVSDIVTDALTAFGLKASDSSHFADVLAATASNANTNVGMLGYSFKYVAPLAGSLKYSVEDVNTALGLMANAGIKGEQSGTQLRNVITNLMSPNKNAAKWINRLGIEIKNADGSMKPFSAVMGKLREQFTGLTAAEKAEAAEAIAGKESMSGLLAIVNASPADYAKMTKAVHGANGAAEKMAKIKMDNLQGDIKLLASAWESFQLSIVKGAGGEGLRNFVQSATDSITFLTDNLKDGFGIDDVGKLVAKTLNGLKEKFLAFDGVGSIIAGGALIGGLMKIIQLSQKAATSISGALKGNTGGVLGGASVTSAGSMAKDMEITANTVVVNGKGVKESAPANTTAGKTGATVQSAPVTWKDKAKAGLKASKGALGIGAVATVGFNAMDYVGAVENGKIRSKEAKDKYNSANDKFFEIDQKWKEAKAKGASKEDVDALAEARTQAFSEREQAKADYIQTDKDVDKANTQAMGKAIGGTVGSVALGAVGAAFGGPAGAMIGMTLGETLGSFVGEGIASVNWSDIFESIKSGFTEFMTGIMTGVSDVLAGVIPMISEGISGAFTVVGNVITAVSETGSAAWAMINEGASMAWEGLTALWGQLPSWFTAVAFGPVGATVEIATSAITGGFDGALSAVQGAWSGLADWFSGIFDSIASTAREKLSGIGSSISGFVGLGHNASGTSRWGGGLTEINEHGGEIVDLPDGSRIYPHATTVDMLSKMLGNSDNAVAVPAPTVNITGNSFTVREEADINRIAYQIVEMMSASAANYGGAY